MLAGKPKGRERHQRAQRVRTAADAMRRRPGLPKAKAAVSSVKCGGSHPLAYAAENARLYKYESRSKEAFDKIEGVLRHVAQYQHRVDFIAQAQQIAQQELGFNLPEHMLDNTWIAPLDMKAMYAWCVFETFKNFANEFYNDKPLAQPQDEGFQQFLESCGFHTLDFSPCADGRLAHIVRYVLRLPHKGVRRKSYAGAMFDVEDSLQKWVETELFRHREGKPNSATEPTRYLKAAVYHYSSSQPDVEGCAAHGSDPVKAAQGALSRLMAFQQGVQNSFCCGASIDLLLIGIDTDNDSIRIHLPDEQGNIDGQRFVDALELYESTRYRSTSDGDQVLTEAVEQAVKKFGVTTQTGMIKLIAKLLLNNLSQIDYVKTYFNGCYSDIGHQERFIGMGVGFEEIQLRNLTYFAYLKTVEQGAKDLDVGIKIFTGLNINRGLPAPVVIRYDYHGNVPGAKERAVNRCKCLDLAMRNRFSEHAKNGLLQTLLVVRDCNTEGMIEVVGSSVDVPVLDGGH